MSRFSRFLKDDVVYFAPGAVQANGQYAYAAPVVLKALWLEATEEFLDRNGAKQVSKTVVFLPQDVQLLGVLWLGTIADLTSESEPFMNPGAYEIRGFTKAHRLRKTTDFVRAAFL